MRRHRNLCFVSIIFFTLFFNGLTFAASDAARSLRPEAYREREKEASLPDSVSVIGFPGEVLAKLVDIHHITPDSLLTAVLSRAVLELDRAGRDQRVIEARYREEEGKSRSAALEKARSEYQDKMEQLVGYAAFEVTPIFPPNKPGFLPKARAFLLNKIGEIFAGKESPFSAEVLVQMLEEARAKIARDDVQTPEARCAQVYFDILKEGVSSVPVNIAPGVGYSNNADVRTQSIARERIRERIGALVSLADRYSIEYPAASDHRYHGGAKREAFKASVDAALEGVPCKNNEDLWQEYDAYMKSADRPLIPDQYYRKAFESALLAVRVDPASGVYWGERGWHVRDIGDVMKKLTGKIKLIICATRYAESWIPYDEKIRAELCGFVNAYIAGEVVDEKELRAVCERFEAVEESVLQDEKGVIFNIFTTIRNRKYIPPTNGIWMLDRLKLRADERALMLQNILREPRLIRGLAYVTGLTTSERRALREWADHFAGASGPVNGKIEHALASALAFISSGSAGFDERFGQLPRLPEHYEDSLGASGSKANGIMEQYIEFFGLSRIERIAAQTTLRATNGDPLYGTAIAQLTEEYADGMVNAALGMILSGELASARTNDSVSLVANYHAAYNAANSI